MNKSPIRLDQYVRELWEQRRQETIKEDIENEWNTQEGLGLTSPAGERPKEEVKLLQMNIMGRNLINIGNALPAKKQAMMLRKFFKHKRNQQIEVFSKEGQRALATQGKVNVIGRDFVMLTTLKQRIWLPYARIESASVPFGLPDVSNTHQHLVFDEELRQRLVTRFGETVSRRDVLVQQFFEEVLETNLRTWRGTRVVAHLDDGSTSVGRIAECRDGVLVLAGFRSRHELHLEQIARLRTIRWLQLIPLLFARRYQRARRGRDS